MDLVVASKCNSIPVINEQAHFGQVLSVRSIVLLEEAPYEICGRNQRLLTVTTQGKALATSALYLKMTSHY